MQFPSYQKFVDSGEMTAAEAAALDAAREHGRISTRDIPIGDHDAHPDAVFMGVLDVAAGVLSRQYGAKAAAEIFRHYGGVCERNAELVGAYVDGRPKVDTEPTPE